MHFHVGPTGAAIASYQAHISSLASSITPRVLARLQGSGNFGEAGASAFYTIDDLPPALLDAGNQSVGQALTRTDMDLPGRLAFYVDDVLSHAEADALAACKCCPNLPCAPSLAPALNRLQAPSC
jgi:hypothetical protein